MLLIFGFFSHLQAIGEILISIGMIRSAKTVLKIVSLFRRKDKDIAVDLANIYILQGKYKKARKWAYEVMYRRDSNRSKELLSQISFAEGDCKKGLEFLESIKEHDPDNAYISLRLSHWSYSHNDIPKAREYIDEYFRIFEKNRSDGIGEDDVVKFARLLKYKITEIEVARESIIERMVRSNCI